MEKIIFACGTSFIKKSKKSFYQKIPTVMIADFPTKCDKKVSSCLYLGYEVGNKLNLEANKNCFKA